AISRETEDKELDAETLTRGVIRFLSQDHYGFYTVAEIDGEVAGSLMITYEWTDWRNGVIWWIQSVYVSAEHRRKGIYTALYENARLLAGDASDVRAIRLYMEKDNEVARQTYQKLGMQETYYRIFEAEYP
ncbi:MAG: GNAT family N-acetyltransferase, partial [Verrucomicrobiales bacterium]